MDEKLREKPKHNQPNKKQAILSIIVIWVVVIALVLIAVFRMKNDYRFEADNVVTVYNSAVKFDDKDASYIEVEFEASKAKPDMLEAKISISTLVDIILSNELLKTKLIEDIELEGRYAALFAVELQKEVEYNLEIDYTSIKAYRSNWNMRFY